MTRNQERSPSRPISSNLNRLFAANPDLKPKVVSERAAISRSYLSKLMTDVEGVHHPSQHVLERLASAFQVPIEEFGAEPSDSIVFDINKIRIIQENLFSSAERLKAEAKQLMRLREELSVLVNIQSLPEASDEVNPVFPLRPDQI